MHNKFIQILIIFLLILVGFFVTEKAHAGLIIKAPAYLGLSNGLVGCWTFDGAYTKAPDCSGNNNTGTLTGGPTKVAGKLGQALSFDGVDDYVSTSMTTNLDSGMTIVGWFNPTSTTNKVIFANGKTTDTGWWDFQFVFGNRIQFGKDGSTDLTARSNIAFSTNSWQHFAMTWTGGATASTDVIFYRNGAIVAHDLNTNGVSLVADSGTQKWIGARTNPTGYFLGTLDEIRVYNRVLSAAEIQRLYRIGLGSTANRSNTDSLKQGLVGCWTFDGAYTKAPDCSGNNNTGTLTNGPVPAQGKIGQALSFDGVNDYVNAGSDSSLDDIRNQGGGGMSVAFWAKVDSNAFSVLFSKGSSTAGWQIQKNNSSNPARLLFRHEGTTDLTISWNNILTTGEWVHTVITWDGTTSASGISAYRNSVLAAVQAGTDGATLGSDASSSLCIGNGGASCGISSSGTDFDDVRIYNRVLSVAEIQRLYRIGLGSTANRSNTDSLKQGLVGCWTFDGAYTKAPDCSGNNNTGTLTNGPVPAQGKIGQALSFDGVNDYLNIPAGASMANIWDSGGTASYWVYLNNAGEGNAGFWLDKSAYWVIFSNSSETTSTATGMEFWIQWSGSAGGSAKWRNFGTSQLKFNQWNHVVIVYDSDSTANDPTAYINGVAYAPSNETIAPVGTRVSDAAQTLQIGSNTTTSRAHNGLLDDVRIYNRALSANEILRLYNMGK